MLNSAHAPSRWLRLACAAVLMACPFAILAQDSAASATQTAPDNSAKNKAHRKTVDVKSGKAADQQKENTSDREITAKIRRSLIADKSLSMYAHNVKIITSGGAVTLKGPVHSEEEKKTVQAKATEVAGEDKVTDQLTISK